jgi:hypothetical protein
VRWLWRAWIVWAAFNLLFGPLAGPDSFKDRLVQSIVPLLIAALLQPIIALLNVRKLYREHGWFGIVFMLLFWFVGVPLIFMGPGMAESHGYPRLSHWLGILTISVLYLIPGISLIVFLALMALRVLRWAFRLLCARGT